MSIVVDIIVARACFVCGSIKHYVSDCLRKAIVVCNQPIAVVLTALIPARGRSCGRGDGGRGAGQCSAARGGDGGLARVYVIREPRIREAIDVIAGTFKLQAFHLLALVDSSSTRLFS